MNRDGRGRITGIALHPMRGEAGGLSGPARIGLVSFSKTGRSL